MTAAVEVWLYGSAARGDADNASDVDLLVVADPDETPALPPIDIDGSLSVSRYDWNEIDAMVAYGSLFLHHIKQEGRALVEDDPPRLRRLLERLPPYSRAAQELASFLQVVADVREAIEADHSPQFELAVLGTAARHATILGCYLIGTPRFGRREPFLVLLPRLGYDRTEVADFERLYAYRLSENRGEPAEIDPRDELLAWVGRVARLIGQVEEFAK
jgi:predicted nucleotidyltransferase